MSALKFVCDVVAEFPVTEIGQMPTDPVPVVDTVPISPNDHDTLPVPFTILPVDPIVNVLSVDHLDALTAFVAFVAFVAVVAVFAFLQTCP